MRILSAALALLLLASCAPTGDSAAIQADNPVAPDDAAMASESIADVDTGEFEELGN